MLKLSRVSSFILLIFLAACIKNKVSEKNQGFIFTDNELIKQRKCKNKSLDELVSDASKGDAAALYDLGMRFLLGVGWPINVDFANSFFAKSASFGFAPALDKVAKMYINDEGNGFLGLVYENLAIAFGHAELSVAYHEMREVIIRDFGKTIIDEIEKIAFNKMIVILKNKNGIESSTDKEEFCELMIRITDEDFKYNQSYWLENYHNNKHMQSIPWYLRIESLDVSEDTKKFLRLTLDAALDIGENLSAYISKFDIQKYLENNVVLLIDTKEGRTQIINDLSALNSIPYIKKEAMDNIIRANNGQIPSDLEEQINRRTSVQINKIVHNFKSRIKC